MRTISVVILLFIITVISKAQSSCNSDYALFNFKGKSNPIIIHTLGVSPQIDFLRGMKEPKTFIEALFTNKNNFVKYKRDIEELDKVLKLIGFKNGINDDQLIESSLSQENIPSGTIGNLGNNNENYQYCKLINPDGFPAWKITSPNGCFFYIFTKCGNLFYPQTPCPVCPQADCPKLIVNYSSTPKELDCVVRTFKKEIKIYVYAYHIFMKRRIDYQQGKGGKIKIKRLAEARDSVCLQTYTTEIETCNPESSHYKISAEPFSINTRICKDTIINQPINLRMEGLLNAVSIVAEEQPINSQDRIIMIEIKDEKIFNSLKNSYQFGNNKMPQ